MNTSDWSRLEDLFHRAAAMPDARRKAFLDVECPDLELRGEVESLLAHDGALGNGLEEAIRSEAEVMAGEGDEWLAGRHIGPYRVEECIGEGGMGAVYRAVRDDAQYHKMVAIKIVQRGMETKALLDRFRAERQILASLTHPYIAQLLDGGATPDGIPYFVMELIEGVPITTYASEHALSIEARLRLFLKVCDAVQHAHTNLIVHRDLKPANILITADGSPKLLDFGLAKILSPATNAVEGEATGTLRMLTPAYASPEQVLGAPITTSTDVYSLGAVLYELLCGAPPLPIEGRTASEIERAICTVEPCPLSERAVKGITPAHKLAGDLDNIVLMALRKEPERRYRSVENLSEDITRHLEGHPVRARPNTVLYRAGKYTRRNRLALTATAAAFVALCIGIVVVNIQKRKAERRFDQVRRLAHTVLFDIHDQIRNMQGATAARQVIVKTGLEYLSNLSEEGRGDATLQEELAEAYLRIGDVQGDPFGGSLGDSKGALDSYRHAVELFRLSLAAHPGDWRLRVSLAEALRRLGVRQSASSEGAPALGSYLESQRILDAALKEKHDDQVALRTAASTARSLSRLFSYRGNHAEALSQARKSLEIANVLRAGAPNDPYVREEAAMALAELGVGLSRSGAPIKEVVDSYKQAAEIREGLVREFPRNAGYRRSLIIDLSHVGDAMGNPGFPNLGDTAGAEEKYRRMLELAESLAAADPANRTAQIDLAQAHQRMGTVLGAGSHERLGEALHHLNAAFELSLKLSAADPNTRSLRQNLSFLDVRIGAIRASQGYLSEGITRMKRGLSVARDLARSQGTLDSKIMFLALVREIPTSLSRAGDLASLNALAGEVEPMFVLVQPKAVPSATAGAGPRLLTAFGEAFELAGNRARACAYFGRGVEAWKQIEAAKGVFPTHKALEAMTMKKFEACRGLGASPARNQ